MLDKANTSLKVVLDNLSNTQVNVRSCSLHSNRGSGRKKSLLRASDSVKRQLVASIEELNTRSMHMQTPLRSLPATAGSHVQGSVLF